MALYALPRAAGQRVLDLGCGNGHLLNALQPSESASASTSARPRSKRPKRPIPHLTFLCDDVENLKPAPELVEPFDVIIMPDTIGSLDDCLATLQELHRFCKPETRLVVSYYTRLWDPIIALYAQVFRPATASYAATGSRTKTSPTFCSSPISKSSSENGACSRRFDCSDWGG